MGFRKILEEYRQRNKLKQINKKKYNLFTVYHKPYELLESNVVSPIHAGRAIAMDKNKDGAISQNELAWMKSRMIGDDIGDNISAKNRYYCENTVTYWIWKNVTSEYVGLMHYRRIFDFSEGRGKPDDKFPLQTHEITKSKIKSLMKEYDIILPKKLWFDCSVYDQYAKYHYVKDLNYVSYVVRNRYPEMVKYLDNIKISRCGYFFNMYFTSKKIFDGYAKWLFDVLFEFERQFDDRDERNLYQQRAAGFLAERLTGIYFEYMINEKKLRVKEFPVVGIEERKAERPKITVRKFTARNSEGKGVSLILRIKM